MSFVFTHLRDLNISLVTKKVKVYYYASNEWVHEIL